MEPRHWQQCQSSPGFFRAFNFLGPQKFAKTYDSATRQERATERKGAKRHGQIKTAAELPCIHRGEITKIVACVPCRSKGFAGAEVFACAKHGGCIINNFATRNAADQSRSCDGCKDREPSS